MLNRTGIETCDFTWNLYTGCLNGCSFCYARKLARGWLKDTYLRNENTSPLVPAGVDRTDPFFPRFWRKRRRDPFTVPETFKSSNPSLRRGTAMIFAIDMGDIFGSSIPADWIWDLMGIIKKCPQVFQILTKFPGNLSYWAGAHGLPENVWAGVTVCNQSMVAPAVECLSGIDAAVKYVCVEPLQGGIVMDLSGVEWMIIGAQTNPLVLSQREWVETLLKEAEESGTKVFLKKSLNWHEDIHEWPEYDGRWQP
jgi:protein gp37